MQRSPGIRELIARDGRLEAAATAPEKDAATAAA